MLVTLLVHTLALAGPTEKAPGGGTIYGGDTFRHASEVIDVAFDRDDKSVWTLTSEQLVRWSLPEGKKLETLVTPCDDGWSSALAMSADGERLAVGCDYGDIQIIDRKGRAVATVPGSASRLQFSDDGKVLGAMRDTEVRWVELASGNVLERLPVSYEASWDHHGNRWAVSHVTVSGGADTGVGSAYDSGEEVVMLEPGKGPTWRKRMPYAQQVAFSADGKQLGVLASERLRTLKPASGERIVGRPLDLEYAYQLAATDHGWWVTTEDTIGRLDKKLERKGTQPGVTEALRASPSGAYLVDLGDALLRVYRSDGTELTNDAGLSSRADIVRSRGDVLAAVNYRDAMVTNRRTGDTVVHPLYGSHLIDIAPDASAVAFAGNAGLLLTGADGKARTVAGLGDMSSIGFLGFSADSTHLYVLWSYNDLTLTRIDVAKAKVVERTKLPAEPSSYTSSGAQLSDDRRQLMVPLDDGRVLVRPL